MTRGSLAVVGLACLSCACSAFGRVIGIGTPQPSGVLAIESRKSIVHEQARAELWTSDTTDRRVVPLTLWFPAKMMQSRGIHVILFSPGADMAPEQYQGLLLDLASRGYFVVGVDHAYEGRGQTVDGRALRPDPEGRRPVMGTTGFDSAFMDFYRFRVRERVADFKSVSAALPSLLQSLVGRQTEPVLVENVAVVGHSIGGVAAFEACRTDATFAACVNLDGWALRLPFFSTARPERLSPVLYVGKPLSRGPAPRSETQRTEMMMREQALRARADSLLTIGGHPHYWVTVWDATHDAFSDGPFRKPGVVAGARSRHLDAVRSYVSGFLDQYLRGVESGLLSPSFRPEFQASLDRR